MCQGKIRPAMNMHMHNKIKIIVTFSTAIEIPSRIPNNSQQDTIIIASTVGAVAFLLVIAILVVMVCICYFIRYSGVTKKKSDDLYAIIIIIINCAQNLREVIFPSYYNIIVLQCCQ